MTFPKEFAHILRFARAVTQKWGSLVTSGVIIGAAAIWQGTGHRVPGSLYWAIALVGLIVACYHAWNEQRLEKEKVIASAKPSYVTSAEWKDLADRFEKKSTFVSAQWTHWSYGNQDFWDLSGPPADRADCEQLCRLAGTMLMKSPRISSELTPAAASQRDSLIRWLNYIKDAHGAVDQRYDAVERLNSGEKNIIIGGAITHIARVSAAACIHCAACEL